MRVPAACAGGGFGHPVLEEGTTERVVAAAALEAFFVITLAIRAEAGALEGFAARCAVARYGGPRGAARALGVVWRPVLVDEAL